MGARHPTICHPTATRGAAAALSPWPMNFVRIASTVDPYLPRVYSVLTAILVLVVGYYLSKWIYRLTGAAFRARKLDPALGGFLGSLLQYAALAAAIITALGAIGIQTTSFVAVFASAGLAIGLALQGSLSSFASGAMLLFFRPFDIEHKITAAGQTGVVKEIGLFSTKLLTVDSEEILVPNKLIADGCIVNHTAMGMLRSVVTVTVAWGNEITPCADILRGQPVRFQVCCDPAPTVSLVNCKSNIDLALAVWSRPGDQPWVLHRVNVAVYDALRAAQVALPDSTITVRQAAK